MKKKNVLFSLIIMFVSVISLWACNPYKNYAMTLSDDSVSIFLSLNDDQTTYTSETQDIEVTLTGGDKSVNKTINLPNSQYASFEKVSEFNGVTRLRITAVQEGSEDIVITSTEGGLSQKLHIDVGVRLKSLSFVDSNNIVIRAGSSLDMSVNSSNYLIFNPIRTTQKDIEYTVVEDAIKSGYAHFEGSVLYAEPIAEGGPDEEIYPTYNGRRYIVVRATSISNPELYVETQVFVADITDSQTIKMNSEEPGQMLELSPNAQGEYEIVVVPESVGGVAVENYLSHRLVTLMIGGDNIEHSNYQINTQLTKFSDPNIDKVGFEYDNTLYPFSFAITGVTAGEIHKSVYVDHKDYVGKFTKEIKFVIKTINIPSLSGMRLNGEHLSQFTAENPFVVYNGYYNESGIDATAFTLGDINVANNFQFKVEYKFDDYSHLDNQIVLKTENNVSIINADYLVYNYQPLFIKHTYEEVDDNVNYIKAIYSYTIAPSNVTITELDNYKEHNVEILVPLVLRIGVTQSEVDTLETNYYINALDYVEKPLLTINSALNVEDQISEVIQSNDIIELSFIDNTIYIKTNAAKELLSREGNTELVIRFGNGVRTKRMYVQSYIPILYSEANTLHLTIDENSIFAVGQLKYEDEQVVSTSNDYIEGLEVGDGYSYKTFTNLIIPTNSFNGIDLNVYSPYQYLRSVGNDESVLDWDEMLVNNRVTFNTDWSDYLRWDWISGKLYTYNKSTTTIVDNCPAPAIFTLTFSGYVPMLGSITEVETIEVLHEINVWIFDKITHTELILGSGELYDYNTVGETLENMSHLDAEVRAYPVARDAEGNITDEKYGVIRREYEILNLDDVVTDIYPEIKYSDLVQISDNVITARYDASKISGIARANSRSVDEILAELYGQDGLRIEVLGKLNQFGKVYNPDEVGGTEKGIHYSTGYIIIKCATKVKEVIFSGINSSGLYFEVRNGEATSVSVSFGYKIYPATATNQDLMCWFENGEDSDYTCEVDKVNKIITVRLKDIESLSDDVLHINPIDNFVKGEDDEQVVNSELIARAVIIKYGDGSSSHKFQIRNILDLEKAIAETYHYHYMLANDINANTLNAWIPNRIFNGNLSGKFEATYSVSGVEETVEEYYSINGLNIVKIIDNADVNSIGLFGTIEYNAVVQDLAVYNANVFITLSPNFNQPSKTLNVGILAGKSFGEIKGVKVTGTISIQVSNGVTLRALNVGGMVGCLEDKSISGEWKHPVINGTYCADSEIVNHENTNIGISIEPIEDAVCTLTNVSVGSLVGSSNLAATSTYNANSSNNLYNIDSLSVISDIQVKVTPNSVGGVVGYAHNTNIGNVEVISNIYGYNVGGVVGTMGNGAIVSTAVKFADSNMLKNTMYAQNIIGGLVGVGQTVQSGNAININYSYVRSFTTAEIVGENESGYKGALLLGNSGRFAGGIIGKADVQATILHSYFDADLQTYGVATTNSLDSNAHVGAFVGTYSKSMGIRNSYIKGRMVVDGSFGVFSGIDTIETSPITTTPTRYSYDVSGTLSYLDDGNIETYNADGYFMMTIAKTTVGVTKDTYGEAINLNHSSTMQSSYVALNNNLFMVQGSSSGTLTFDTAVSTKTVSKVEMIIYMPNENNETQYIMIAPSRVTTTVDATGTTVQAFEGKFDYTEAYEDAHNELHTVVVNLVDNTSLFNVEETPTGTKYYFNYRIVKVSKDDSTAENYVNINFLTSSVGDSAGEDNNSRMLFGGYYFEDGELKYQQIEIKEVDEEDPTSEPIVVYTITKADADAELINLFKLATGTVYVDLDDAITGICMTGINSPNENYDILHELEYANITFADLNGAESNYNYFDETFGHTVTTGEIGEVKTIAFGQYKIYDTAGNEIATISFSDGVSYHEFDWMVAEYINGGMPIILKEIGNISLGNLTNYVIYRAMYDSLPDIDAHVLSYPVSTLDEDDLYYAQNFYQLTDDSVMLMSGRNYKFVETVTSAIDEVIQVQVVDKTLAAFEHRFLIFNTKGHFVELICSSEVTYISSDENVIKFGTDNVIKAVGSGNAIITISSIYDSSYSVSINVVVVPSFYDFKLTNAEGNTERISALVGTVTDVYPWFIEHYAYADRDDLVNVPGGMFVQFDSTNDTITLNGEQGYIYVEDELGNYVIDSTSGEYRDYVETTDTGLQRYSRQVRTILIDNLGDIRITGLSKGAEKLYIIPFVYVSENTVGAQAITLDSGETRYIVKLGDMVRNDSVVNISGLTKIYSVEIIDKAKSIEIIGDTSTTRTPDSVVEFTVEIVSSVNPNTISEDIKEGLLNTILPALGADEELVKVTTYLESVDRLSDDDGPTLYKYTYLVALQLDFRVYSQYINNNVNPLTQPLTYAIEFSPKSNADLTVTYTYTLTPNTLTRFDVDYYPNGEGSGDNTFNPYEQSYKKIVPGKSGLIKITPQRAYNNASYIEITSTSEVRFTQIYWSEVEGKYYEQPDKPATIINNGIRLWNVITDGFYDGIYYVWLTTPSTLPQGQTITFRIAAYDINGNLIYSQNENYVTEFLPSITALIKTDDGYFDLEAEVALDTVTPVSFVSSNLDGLASYSIISNVNTSTHIDKNKVYLATYNGGEYVPVTPGYPRLVSGTAYYLVVSKDYILTNKTSKIRIDFTGSREVNGVIEWTSTSIYVQIVYIKIGTVMLSGTYPKGNIDEFTIMTGYTTELKLKIYSLVSLDNDIYVRDENGNVKYVYDANNNYVPYTKEMYLKELGRMFSANTYKIHPFYEVDSTEPIDSPYSNNYFLVSYEQNKVADIVYDPAWYLTGVARGKVNMFAKLEYYYDECGYIQLYEPLSDSDQRSQTCKTRVYYFDMSVVDGSTEDRPIPITNQEELYALKDYTDGNYILINDITLEYWIPFDLNVSSFDGNSFRIILKSFDLDNDEVVSSAATLGLFRSVGSSNSETIVKNLTLDLCEFYAPENDWANESVLDLTNITRFNEEENKTEILNVTNLTFGFFAATNDGTITNCAVINTNQRVQKITIKTHQSAIGSVSFAAIVAGFVNTNSGSISNSYIGLQYNNDNMIITGKTDDKGNQLNELQKIKTYAFDLSAGQILGGFIYSNAGIMSNNYVKGVGLVNMAQKENGSALGGFVVINSGTIGGCFIEGAVINSFRADKTLGEIGWRLQSIGTVGGFVHENQLNGTIKNSYSKMIIKVNSVTTGGFAYKTAGSIKSCYTTTINSSTPTSYANGPFVGYAWDIQGTPQYGDLEYCYYLVLGDEFGSELMNGTKEEITRALSAIDPANPILSNAGDEANFQAAASFEGFSITANDSDKEQFVWFVDATSRVKTGPSLTIATSETLSYRVYRGISESTDPITGEKVEYHSYSYNVAYQFGSKVNPVVLYSANNLVRSLIQYSKPYTVKDSLNNTIQMVVFGKIDNEVDGVFDPTYIRVVSDINLSESALKTKYYLRDGVTLAALSDIIFSGKIDGNGMTISGIKLSGESQDRIENYGLFNQIGLSEEQKRYTIVGRTSAIGEYVGQTPMITDLNFEYEELSNASARKVGVLAGSIYNAVLYNVSVSGVAGETQGEIKTIGGWNLVGGLAGLISGPQMRLTNITLNNIRVKAINNTLTNVGEDYIDYTGYYDKYQSPQTGSRPVESKLIELSSDGYTIENESAISYAGTVAGAIIINNYKEFSKTESTTTITKSLLASDSADIITNSASPEKQAEALRYTKAPAKGLINNITVGGFVDVVADQAGGLFGYVGNNTFISDSQLVLETYNQHIYGYSYTGGIVGEMKGGVLERVEIRHNWQLQAQLDDKFNNGTPGMLSTTTLFKNSDLSSNNVVISIGGLVGYSERSIILDSYSKVNVTNEHAKIAGGIVGYAKGFNYIGFTYTTGDVLAKEIVGGLVGFYTYRDYDLYLQEAVALNRWGSGVQTKLQSNHRSVYGSEYNTYTDKIVMPEIGNETSFIVRTFPRRDDYVNSYVFFNGTYQKVTTTNKDALGISPNSTPAYLENYGDNPVVGEANYYYIGSLVGKATLQPGIYSFTTKYNNGSSNFNHTITIGDGADLGNLGEITLTGTFDFLPRYYNTKRVKNLLVNDGIISAPVPSVNSVPLYATNGNCSRVELVKSNIPNEIYGMTVLDKTYWNNKYNYNVYSTTYSELTKINVSTNVISMNYEGKSFVLINKDMDDTYNSYNSNLYTGVALSSLDTVDKYVGKYIEYVDDNSTYGKYILVTSANKSTLGISPRSTEAFELHSTHAAYIGDDNTVRYPSILGKQSYAEMITGYFRSNNTYCYNYGEVKFENVFDTIFGYTKYLLLNDGIVTGISGSETWYKQYNDHIYFPEYSYGQMSSFTAIRDGNTLFTEFSKDTAGKFYTLSNEVVVSRELDNEQVFNGAFNGVLNGLENNKIILGQEGVPQILFEKIVNATISNVNFVFNLDSYAVIDGTAKIFRMLSSNGAFGMLAKSVQNASFSNCTFTFNFNNINTIEFSDIPGYNYTISDAGLLFGKVTGLTMQNCGVVFNWTKNSGTPAKLDYKLNQKSQNGNYGMLIGKLESANINNFTVKNFYHVNYIGAGNCTDNSGYGLNLGGIFGLVTANSKINKVGCTNCAFTISIDGTYKLKTNQSVNVGAFAGVIASNSIISDIDIYSVNIYTRSNIAINNSGYLTIGTLCGISQNSMLTNMRVGRHLSTSNNTAKISINHNIAASQLHIGGVVGIMDLEMMYAVNKLSEITTEITISSSYNNAGELYVGGIAGSSGTMGGEITKPSNSTGTIQDVTTFTNLVYLGKINLNAAITSAKYYVGGIVGYARYTNLDIAANFADITIGNTLTGGEGYIGGLFGVWQVPSSNYSSSYKSISNTMTYGRITIPDLHTSSYYGGFVGALRSNITSGNTFSCSVENSYSYIYMDTANKKAELTHYDIICPTSTNAFSSVVYIKEMMAIRQPNAQGDVKDYNAWYNGENPSKYPQELFNYSASNNALEQINDYITRGNLYSTNGTIFNPLTTLNCLNNAVGYGVYYLSNVPSTFNGNTIPNAMIVLASNAQNKLIECNTSAKGIENNGKISGFAFKINRSTNKSLFSRNNGTLYNCSVYGEADAASYNDNTFSAVADENNGFIASCNVSVTLTNSNIEGLTFNGIVGTNNGAIERVACTSGTLVKGMSAHPIGTTNGGIVRDVVYAGVMNVADTTITTSLTTCTTTTNKTSGKTYEELIELPSNGNYSYLCVDKDANFGMPYINSAPTILTISKYDGGTYYLYRATNNTDNSMRFVRTLQDIIWSNVNSGVSNITYHVLDDITLSEYAGKYTSKEVIGLSSANSIKGNEHKYLGSPEDSDVRYALDEALIDYCTLIEDYTMGGFSVPSTLITKVDTLRNVGFNRINITLDSDGYNVGVVGEISGSATLNGITAITIDAQDHGAYYVGIIASITSTNSSAEVRINGNISNVIIKNLSSGWNIGIIAGFSMIAVNGNSCDVLDSSIQCKGINRKAYIGGTVGSAEKSVSSIGCHTNFDLELKDKGSTPVNADSSDNKYYIGGVVGYAKGSIISCTYYGSMKISNLPLYTTSDDDYKKQARSNQKISDLDPEFKLEYDSNYGATISSNGNVNNRYPIEKLGIGYQSGLGGTYPSSGCTMELTQNSAYLSVPANNYGVVSYFKTEIQSKVLNGDDGTGQGKINEWDLNKWRDTGDGNNTIKHANSGGTWVVRDEGYWCASHDHDYRAGQAIRLCLCKSAYVKLNGSCTAIDYPDFNDTRVSTTSIIDREYYVTVGDFEGVVDYCKTTSTYYRKEYDMLVDKKITYDDSRYTWVKESFTGGYYSSSTDAKNDAISRYKAGFRTKFGFGIDDATQIDGRYYNKDGYGPFLFYAYVSDTAGFINVCYTYSCYCLKIISTDQHKIIEYWMNKEINETVISSITY